MNRVVADRRNRNGRRRIVGVIVAILVFTVILTLIILRVAAAFNPTHSGNVQRQVTITNSTDQAFRAEYQQSQNNTWHTTVVSEQPLLPGASITVSYQVGDRMVLWPPEDSTSTSLMAILVLSKQTSLAVEHSGEDEYLLVDTSTNPD